MEFYWKLDINNYTPMTYTKNFFKGKRIVVMGLGFHGGGVAVARWLAKNGAKVVVTDIKTRQELKLSLEKLKGLPVKYHLGGHRSADFKNADIVVQNPAVPRESRYLKIAAKAGAEIENEATLFFKLHNPQKIIGITGTRGKSTVSTLLLQILRKKYKKIKLAGNIGSTVMFDIVDKVKKNDQVILELSSWHLENLGQKRLSPHIAVITNIMPDHLNRYKGLKDYMKAKGNILRFQEDDDMAVLNRDNNYTKQMGKIVGGRRFWFSKKVFPEENGTLVKNNTIIFRFNGKEKKVCSLSSIKLRGEHNLENILASITVASILGVNSSIIRRVVNNFDGLGDRLELIKSMDSVKYYNDTTSTIPEATIFALKTLANKKNIILIAGGVDKKLNFKNLAREIKKYCKVIILFKGGGSNKMINELEKIKYKPFITNIKLMSDAVGIAKSFSRRGDIILLSPACASFNLFVNEFDRGRQFKEIVKKIK